MRRSQNARRERHGVRITREVVEGTFGWDFIDTASPVEVGVDAYVEVVGTEHDEDLITGRVLALQIKDGESYLKATLAEDAWRFNENDDHQSYWLGHSLPVIVVLVHPEGRAWWGHISTDAAIDFSKGFRIDIPLANVLDASAKTALTQIAGTFRGVADRLEELYAQLPTDAVAILRRAEGVDRLATARLAQRLVSGTVRAADAVALLLNRASTWLTRSPAAQDLWLAIAAFATEHELDSDLSCAAFEAAATSPGPRAARARAFAGLTLIFSDQRERARRLLQAARDGGEVLLADFGLAALDVAPNTAPVVAVPASIAAATDEQLDTEPTLLNFLGEMAKRERRFDEGIAFRRRAVNRPDPGASVMLELAKELYQRALREGRSAGNDVREALELAQKAALDRRRWIGPSGGAVEVVAQILYMTGENRQVIAETTSNEDGGRAVRHEAADSRVIRVGALAALASGDDEAWDRYLSLLGPIESETRTHLLALRASLDDDISDAETVAQWTKLANEASDDSHAASAVARLAHLGVWSSRADDLVARSILPASEVEMLRAVVLARTDSPAGIVRLRALARTSPMAAVELVLAIDASRNFGLDAALEESRRQFDHWKSWDLAEQQMSLLMRKNDEARAWEVGFACVRDSNFSVGSRQRAARWLVKSLTAAGEHNRAVEAAEAALGISADENDLAWMLVTAHYNSGNIPRARGAADRWQLTPVTDQEIELWLVLRQGADLSPANARILLDLLDRLPAGRFGNHARALAIREILTPVDDTINYSTDIIDAATNLAREADVPLTADHIRDGSLVSDEDNDAYNPDDGAARPRRRPTPADLDVLVQRARAGLISVAELAIGTDRTYTATLIDNPAGAVVAADAGEALRAAGSAFARTALDAAAWVIDLSTVSVLTHPAAPTLHDSLQLIPPLIVAGRSLDDIVAARDQVRGVALAISIAATGETDTEQADPAHVDRVRRHAARMESLAAAQTTIGGDRHLNDPLQATIELAAARELPLWCDDAAGRQRARRRGVDTFSTADLIDVLEPANRTELMRDLARGFVLDLPLTAEDMVALARDTRWASGPAHAALASRGLWRNWDVAWVESWRTVCAAASADAATAEQMMMLTSAALSGAFAHVSSGREIIRFAHIAMTAVAQAHLVNRSFDTAGYLEALAAQVSAPSVVPGPRALIGALTAELTHNGITDASARAIEILQFVA